MILLGFGSNLSSNFGDRFKNIDLSILHLKNRGVIVKKKSSYYETYSYPNKKKPKFINIVASVETKLSPSELASQIIAVEKTLGRVRKNKNDPRTCDIDIIDYKGQIFNFKYNNLDFTVPHKELEYRNFVLYPIEEILPGWRHPKTNKPVAELIKKLTKDDKNSILKINKY